MGDFRVNHIHVNQFRLVQVEDQDTGLTYEVYLHTIPSDNGGSDLQVIVDALEGLTIWKCLLSEIHTPRVDALRIEHRNRLQAELPGETVYGRLDLSGHIQSVVADVMEAYVKENKARPRSSQVERVSRYRRDPVI